MKYLLQEYCTDYCSDWNYSTEELEYRTKMWKQQSSVYDKQFNIIKKKLDQTLVDYISSGFFHDSFIQSIKLIRAINSLSSRLRIVFFREDLNYRVTLEYFNVISIKSDLDFCGSFPFGEYRYGEFLYENSQYTHNFVLRKNSEIGIKCMRINVV